MSPHEDLDAAISHLAEHIILAVSLASGPGTLLVRQAVKWPSTTRSTWSLTGS